MKRRASLLIALVLAAVALAVPPNPTAYVVVDPLDLRKPVPEPEGALTEKYNDKLVRFTGVVRRASLDRRTKMHRFELHHDIVQQVRVKGKKPMAVTAETIVISVSFRREEKGLLTRFQNRQKARQPGPTVTVEGKGAVMVDGTLVISDAVIITRGPFEEK